MLRLLTLPISGPLWIVQQVVREVQRRASDPRAIGRELSTLARRRETNEIDEENFRSQEALLMDRLAASLNKEVE